MSLFKTIPRKSSRQKHNQLNINIKPVPAHASQPASQSQIQWNREEKEEEDECSSSYIHCYWRKCFFCYLAWVTCGQALSSWGIQWFVGCTTHIGYFWNAASEEGTKKCFSFEWQGERKPTRAHAPHYSAARKKPTRYHTTSMYTTYTYTQRNF